MSIPIPASPAHEAGLLHHAISSVHMPTLADAGSAVLASIGLVSFTHLDSFREGETWLGSRTNITDTGDADDRLSRVWFCRAYITSFSIHYDISPALSLRP